MQLLSILALIARAAVAPAGPPHADFTITARDFRLDVPPTVAAGWRTVRLRSAGKEFHHAVFLHVSSAAAADSVLGSLAAWQRDWDEPIAGAISAGGVEGATSATGSASAPPDTYGIVDLQPGHYLVVCMVRGAAGTLHVNRGMHALLRVTAPVTRAGHGAAPAADLTVRTSDYSYRLSRSRLTPGWHLIAVQNDGPSEHATEVARLPAGRLLVDVVGHLHGTPDPIESVVGGAPRVLVGGRTYAWVWLARGAYVIQCPMRTREGWRHNERGMVAELVVR